MLAAKESTICGQNPRWQRWRRIQGDRPPRKTVDRILLEEAIKAILAHRLKMTHENGPRSFFAFAGVKTTIVPMMAGRKFHAFLKEWKGRRHQQRRGGVGKWERKIQANPYRLHPKELLALRRARFPLSSFAIRWIDQYLELYAYTKRHGHSLVPARAGGSLGRWVASQRKFRRKNRLPLQRQVALNRLRFCWDVKESFWLARISELARFIQKHGHMRVPDQPPHQCLVIWIDNVRQRRQSLTSKQQSDLYALEFVWSPNKDARNLRLPKKGVENKTLERWLRDQKEGGATCPVAGR